jgi:uncharacterized pyridoxamine 5'-phosphate oxidase family protein
LFVVAAVTALLAVTHRSAYTEGHKHGEEADAVTMATAPPPDYPHDIKAAADFLGTTPIGYLATVENGKPRVRAWSHLKMAGDTLYFGTDNQRAVFQQLKETPYAEYIVMNPQTYATVRFFGEVVFVDDVNLKKKAIESNPMLKNMYSGEREKEFEMFYIPGPELNWFSFTQPPGEIKEDAAE